MRLVQWNKDVESYGDKAIELWEYKHENSQEWRDCTQGINPSWNAQQFEYKRKESAALYARQRPQYLQV
jgi:hypothetical protein